MFFRIFRDAENKEVLYNVNQIRKIEVKYGVFDETTMRFRIQDVRSGIANPDQSAYRVYRVFVAGDVLTLLANPEDPVVQLIDKLYNESVKSRFYDSENEFWN